MASLPERLAIKPLGNPPDATISVPGSKSITNRALVLAALSARTQPITLNGVLRSEDTEVMVACLNELGFSIRTFWDEKPPRIHVAPVPVERIIPREQANLFASNSGTTIRFLTAMVSLGQGRYRLHGAARMHERPIRDLLDALDQLGVCATSEKNNGCPPVVLDTKGWTHNRVAVRGGISSQFLSGLLLAAPFAAHDTAITFDETIVSRPYLDMTLAMLRQWGLVIREEERTGSLIVPAPQQTGIASYEIEPDASAASYFLAAAAITGGRMSVPGLGPESLQGDVRFVDMLERMGCEVQRRVDAITVHGGQLRGIDCDMNAISDTVMTLGVVACFAEGPTTIRNVAHIRHKESDRLSALATELRRVGARVEEFADGLRIEPGPLHGAEIETYNDHRMAMSLALVGLRVPGIIIKGPGCVAKTYPAFFDDLEKLQ